MLSHPGQLNMPMPEPYIQHGAAGRAFAAQATIPAAQSGGAQQGASPSAIARGAGGPLPADRKAPGAVNYDDLAKLESYRLAQVNHIPIDWHPTPSLDPHHAPVRPSGVTPSFASTKPTSVPVHLINELQTLNTHILRERLFLLGHTAIFLTANLVGLFLAIKCYYGYNGDEVSRMVMALTPLTFINAVALACLAPIKGTRREIARLLEKRQFLRIQIEYSNVRF